MKHSLKRKIFRSSFLVLFGTILISCGGAATDTETSDFSGQYEFEGFEDFPINQYYGIQLGQEYKAAELVLFDQGFVRTEENESIHFWRNSDSTEVILPENPTIYSFRIFLSSKLFLSKKQEFYSFLSEKASKMDKNKSFRVMEFSHESTKFKMTVFEQSDILRIEFEAN